MPTIADRITVDATAWQSLIDGWGYGVPPTGFDSRPTWDNRGQKFDNRPTWDNWSKAN